MDSFFFALEKRIVRARRDMPDFVLDAWLEEGCRRGQPHLLHRLVDFLGRHRVWPNAGVADRLGRAFQEAGGYTATHTTVDSATGRYLLIGRRQQVLGGQFLKKRATTE